MDESSFEPDFLCASRIAVWGLGLMGGSLAMALKDKCAGLIGIDADPAAVALALEWGIVDAASTNPGDVLPGCDVIILAVPVREILALLPKLDQLCLGPAVVMDLGSTKARIVQAMQTLPERFDPVGGHPMCGKEKSTLQYAEAQIYQDAPFALLSLERTSQRAKQLAEELVTVVGARPLWLDAAEHDRWVAATSHVPYLLSSALAGATPGEVKPLVGSGFRSTARLAGSSTRMMSDIIATNAESIRVAMKDVMNTLQQYENLLEVENFDALVELLDQSREQYRYFTEIG